jgi:DNA-binding NarL/FixJ family response regulator
MVDEPSSANAVPQAAGAARSAVAVVVVEDNRLLYDALCDMLRQQPDFDVYQSAADASVSAQLALAETVGENAAHVPVVVLLDVSLGERDSVMACARLCRTAPNLRVIVMGMMAPQEEIADFVSAGAVAFSMKDASAAEFVRTIRQVAQGEPLLPPALTQSLFAQIVRERDRLVPAVIEESVRLTVREREIISLLGEGLSNRDIAARLHIAIHTVKSHVHNILEKLSLRSRLEVVALSRVIGPPR